MKDPVDLLRSVEQQLRASAQRGIDSQAHVGAILSSAAEVLLAELAQGFIQAFEPFDEMGRGAEKFGRNLDVWWNRIFRSAE